MIIWGLITPFFALTNQAKKRYLTKTFKYKN